MKETELKKLEMMMATLNVMMGTLREWVEWASESGLHPDDKKELNKGIQRLQKAIQEEIEKLKEMQS